MKLRLLFFFVFLFFWSELGLFVNSLICLSILSARILPCTSTRMVSFCLFAPALCLLQGGLCLRLAASLFCLLLPSEPFNMFQFPSPVCVHVHVHERTRASVCVCVCEKDNQRLYECD